MKAFKFKIGQIVAGMEIIWRFHGEAPFNLLYYPRELNFYDVRLKNGRTWTYDEQELVDFSDLDYNVSNTVYENYLR